MLFTSLLKVYKPRVIIARVLSNFDAKDSICNKLGYRLCSLCSSTAADANTACSTGQLQKLSLVLELLTFWLIGHVTRLLLCKDSSSGKATPKRKVSRSDAHSRTLYEHPL